MKIISIKPQRASNKLFLLLQEKKLIRVIGPSAKLLKTRTKTGTVDFFYRSNPGQGGHCLLGVGKRNTEIQLSFHPGNEDLILLRPGKKKYKKLYLILSLLKSKSFLSALKNASLKPEDFVAVELEFNNPKNMFFTVLKDTVHCEITVPGPGQHPVFFVTEPSGLKMNRVKTNKYQFKISDYGD